MSTAENQSYSLPTNMDIDSIDTIRDWLLSAFENGAVALDGAQVERVYTNCLLMIISASAEAASHGHKLILNSASPALLEAISTLGLKPQFSDILES